MASEAKRAKQDSSQMLYEKLKCYICESRLTAGKHHWYRCLQDHMICQDCREVKETKKCSCTKSITLQYCQVIEALLNTDKMRFKCENLLRGCQESSNKENMILHQIECIYRLVECPRIGCRSKVQFHGLLDHMKPKICLSPFDVFDQYNEMTYIYDQKNKADAYYYDPRKITVKNKIFFSVIRVKSGVLYHWIHIYGSTIEAKNYSYTLKYYNDTKTPKVTNSFSDQVVSIDETPDSIIENGNCFSMSRKVFENKFLQESEEEGKFKFKFSVKIRNLKEEVKDENVESGV